MVGEVFAGMSALKTAFDLAKGLKDINDATVRNGAIIDLQEKILSAQQQQAALIDSVRSLETEVAGLKAWDAEKLKYELRQASERTSGVFAYARKTDAEPAQPAHWLCPTCFDDGHKSVLQQETLPVGRTVILRCNRCGSDLVIAGMRHEPAPRVHPRR
jgi:hypothetical protein